MFLYESIESSKMYGGYADLPRVITQNLNPNFKIRPYQETAFRNYVTYFENPNLRKFGNRTLFHMATGSGKTYIMAGLIIYLYQKGYRNFLFFVPLSNIKSKTIDNFTEPASSKYLFADSIVVDGIPVQIRTVNNFQDTAEDRINICFTTIQQIHHDYWDVKENAITMDDFENRKIVFISDEAHHLTADTQKGKSRDEESRSWEYVAKRLFKANHDNIMLEFTATCNLEDPNIREEYESKIVYQYDLKQFRHERFSKEVQTLQSNLDFLDMSLQAMILSQYRLHLFNDLKQDIKPIILFKSAKIVESNEFKQKFDTMLAGLTGDRLAVLEEVNSQQIQNAFSYFSEKGISLDLLAKELQEGFNKEHTVQVTDDSTIKSNDTLLNSLERKDNPIRAIFEVKALDEGWDVLNLFDIVRLYDTRDAKNGIPGKTTISEAQLIGRGARYCPFVIDDEDERYIRKFDDDLENRYRICEEMYYHCHSNSRYIDELHKALIQTGMRDENVRICELRLKDPFKQSRLYRSGTVLVNDQRELNKGKIDGLLPKIRSGIYRYTAPNKNTTISALLEKPEHKAEEPKLFTYKVKEIAEINYNTVHSAIRRFPNLRLNKLQSSYSNIDSMRDFITSDHYLGSISLEIYTVEDEPSMDDLFNACLKMAEKVSFAIGDSDKFYEGTKEFRPVAFKDLFYDKVVNYQEGDAELGMPQSESSDWRLDLSDKDWYVFNENYGTSEEKGFVKYFSQRIQPFYQNYDEIYLVRNERHMHIFSFDGGSRFEPDYLLFLIKGNEPIEQLQVFIEPKGAQLMEKDRWKQDFLLDIEKEWHIDPRARINDTKFRIVGLPFYNNNDYGSFEEQLDGLNKS